MTTALAEARPNAADQRASTAEMTNAGPADGASIMVVISKAASDPNTDTDKLERLLAMYERIAARDARQAFTSALAELQPQLPVIDENGGIKNNAGTVQSTYAKWEDINDAIKPLLHDHGFALSFRVSRTEAMVSTTAILSHRAGHSEETTLDLPADASGSKNGVQAIGSSFSYGKRYTAIALLNITSRLKSDRDDDGAAAGAREASAACQRAMTEINLGETKSELRAWKEKNLEGISKVLDAGERRQVIELYNRRIKSAPEGAVA